MNSLSQRQIAHLLNRSPSTISREIRRNHTVDGDYSIDEAQHAMLARRRRGRPHRKLNPDSELFELVIYLLRKRFSPEQIAGQLRDMEFPSFEDAYIAPSMPCPSESYARS